MSSTKITPGTNDGTQMRRGPIVAILALALLLVAGVLFGARYVFTQAASQPVAMPELPSPMADTAECAEFVAALPERVADYPRAELAEPAPAGAAAWQRSSTERVTLRCGVELPAQYDEYAEQFLVTELGDVTWLQVADPASTMATWFTVNRSPVVAVTADTEHISEPPVVDIDASSLPQAEIAPAPSPTSTLAAGDTAVCGDLEQAAPVEIAEGFVQVDSGRADTLVWIKPGYEPVVLRCGVAPPPGYAPGAALTQVNDIAWFEEVPEGELTTVYYALGRATDIAATFPITGSNEIITNLSDFIAEAVPAD